MSEVITRFKLETTQYDSKLRDASRSLADLARHLSMAGKDFDAFAQKHVASAAALGQVASGANNTKDKLKDLVAAYNETAKAYNVLTNEQKSTDFGKAMAESLVTLRDRIKETKTELYSVGDGAKGTGSIMDQLASKFTINIDAMKLFNVGLQAAQKALNVVKDAFFSSESNVDEWGRTVASAESLYSSFVLALNSSDFSSFLQRIGEVTQSARDAYNAMDELNTRMTIINPERVKLQTLATQYKATIRREGKDSEAGRQALENLKKLEPQLAASYKTESKLNWRAFEAEVDKKLKEAGIELGKESKKVLMESFHSDETFMRLKAGARGEASRKEIVETPFGRGVRDTADTRNVNQKLLDLFTDEWRKQYSPYISASFSALSSSASVMLSDARYVNGGNGGGGNGGGGGRTVPKPEEIIPAGSVADLTKQMSELRKEQNLVTNTQDWKTYEERIKEITNYIKGVKGELSAIGVGGLANASGVSITGGASESVDSQQKGLKDKSLNMETVNEKIAAITKGGKDAEASWREAAQAIGSVGSALAGIEDPAVKIAGTIGIAIANIAAGFAEASAKEGKGGIWYWIAATASGLATMISTISTIHSATGYARGGIVDGTTGGFVGGSSFSGDNIGNVRLDSGELVLNRSMQNNLANALQDSRNDYAESRPYVTGEMIYLALNNYMRRSGHGEILKVR